jgi:hypothetical protein
MAIKTWILDDPISPEEMTRIERTLYAAKSGGTTTGTSTNYVITLDYFTLTDLVAVYVKIHADNAANPTLNVNSTGAKPLYTTAGTAIAAGALKAGSIIHCLYGTDTGRYYVFTGENPLGYTPVNKAGDTGIGTLTISGSIQATDAAEHQFKKNNATAHHGAYVADTGVGIYDWKNSRGAFVYTPASNSIDIGYNGSNIIANGTLSAPLGLVIEARTTDPAGAAVGRMWLRTDL